MDRDGNRSRPSAQKGVLLVFTALLLPVVFCLRGAGSRFREYVCP